MKIDIGVTSQNDALKLVDIGDTIIIDGNFMELTEHRFVSRGLDDKLGVFIVAEVLKQLKENADNNFKHLKNLTVYGSACTQEETGGSGAVNLGKINPEDFGKTLKCNLKEIPNDLDEFIYPCAEVKIHPSPHEKTLWAGIYCHFDGYLDGVGSELVEKFDTYEKLSQLGLSVG